MRIEVNRKACDGNGLCAAAAPDLLAMDEADELVILKPEFDEDQLAAANRAALICPKAALNVRR